jgi:BirA family biotin operon repressor/biotin-[acetyl-CoA-carboxylase] ligase
MDLTAENLRSALAGPLMGSLFGRSLEVHESLPSTQARAKELAAAGAPEGTCVLALEQTRGRGQFERTWRSDRGKGVYLSAVLRPPWPSQESGRLSPIAALAVSRALDRLGVRGSRIKAPNDVYAGARKIAGVLVEPRLGAGRIEFAIVGIGLNLTYGPADWQGTKLDGRATSCAMEGAEVPLAVATAEVLAAMDALYRANRDGRGDALAAEWAARGGTPEVPGKR